MANFQHSFPELQDNATNLTLSNGAPVINGVPFSNLRLHQLRNLARAWKINLDFDAPKPDIMPALMVAVRQGVFQRPPSLPYYAYMAMRTGDEKGPINHPHFEYPDGMPTRPISDDALPSEARQDKKDDPYYKMYAQWGYDDLKNEARRVKPDINLYGVSRAALGRLLYENGVPPTSKPVHADPVLKEESHANPG